ncbi:MAG: EMC3/TMCO1 family protein [Candidatus Micrarchaeia archaeon]
MITIELFVALVAILYTLLSFIIQRKVANMKKVYEMQEKIKAKSKELNEMVKSGIKNEELLAKQKEVMGLATESMVNQMKPMVIILPLFLIVYYLLLPALFPNNPTFVFGSFKLTYNTLFILIVFIFGFILSFSFLAIDKSKRAKQARAAQAAEANKM